MPCASVSMLDGPGGTRTGPSSIENDARSIEKLLLKTQVSLTSFLQSEVKIIHIIVQDQDGRNNNICKTFVSLIVTHFALSKVFNLILLTLRRLWSIGITYSYMSSTPNSSAFNCQFFKFCL